MASVFPLDIAALGLLVGIHLFINRLSLLRKVQRERWLSFAGGVSVAFVFTFILPELGAAQEDIEEFTGTAFSTLDNTIYLIALFGLVTFFWADWAVRVRQEKVKRRQGFFISHVSFAAYNIVIGYLMASLEGQGLVAFSLLTSAFALHLLVADHSIWRDHGEHYDRRGRYILSGSLIAGFLIGYSTQMGMVWISVLLAALAGGIILNVMKEELPVGRENRLVSFTIGAIGYALIVFVA